MSWEIEDRYVWKVGLFDRLRYRLKRLFPKRISTKDVLNKLNHLEIEMINAQNSIDELKDEFDEYRSIN